MPDAAPMELGKIWQYGCYKHSAPLALIPNHDLEVISCGDEYSFP